MYYSERYKKIEEIVKERHSVSVHYLAEKLFVSEPTVRRDLAVLEEEGKLKRTYGGAVLSGMINNEIPLSLRENTNVKEKTALSKTATKYIKNGQTIFLDASSTVLTILPFLSEFSDLTVITNSPRVSLKLAEMKIKCLCTGGILLENSIAYVGAFAENFIKNFNADIFFFSCRGFSNDGKLTDSSLDESLLRQAMIRNSKQQVCLCTKDKIGNEYLYNLCNKDEITEVITSE